VIGESMGEIAAYCASGALSLEQAVGLAYRFAESLHLETASLQGLAGLSSKDDAVVVDLRLIELLKTGSTAEPGELLSDIDARILQPLSSAARRLRKSLRLRAGFELDFELTPLAGFKFWRRSRGLETWAGRREDP